MKRGQVAHNPFEKVVSLVTLERERVLTDAELTRVWEAAMLEAAPYGPILKLLVLTGQRREEVAGMDWSELSHDLLTWSIPGSRTKNHLPQDVPLGPIARAILGKPPKRRQSLVFPGTSEKEFGNFSKRKALLDEVSDWVLHDIRRTVATNLQRLGVRLEVTEAILNHVSGTRSGVAGIYHRHKWTDEKAAALLAWEARLLKLLHEAQAADAAAKVKCGLGGEAPCKAA